MRAPALLLPILAAVLVACNSDTGDDTGPDAALVARVADAVVVVTGMGDTSARELRRALDELGATGAPLAGVVANRVHRWRRRPRTV